MLISLIIPCRNESVHIDACLDSALAQQLPFGATLEILVADGQSTDGTRERLEARRKLDPRIRLIDNPQKIVSIGLNAAIRAAQGEIVVRFDAHTRYASDYVIRCVETLERSRSANVGGPQCAEATGYWQTAIAAAHLSPFAVGGALSHNADYEGEVDTVIYGCWRKQTLLDIGLFDESLVRNQDDELNFRIVQSGGRIWQTPRIKSWYRPRGSLGSLFRQYQQYGYWKVAVIKKHRRPASWRHLMPVLFTAGLAFGWLSVIAAPYFGAVYFGSLAVYALFSLWFSARAGAAHGWRLFPAMPLVFLTYHVAYGVGFVRGLMDFVLVGRGPQAGMTALSRPTVLDPAVAPRSRAA